VRETAPDDIGVSVSYPLRGTRFHQNVAAQLGPVANWSDSADLAMMFHGAYPSDFYRALADALHLEVRGGPGLAAAWDLVNALERRTRRENQKVIAVAS
jgi:anaerobic magnesium-protoporphyrin IX monomethyl ester cyclase